MISFQFVALLDVVAHECAVTRKDILGKSREAQIANARAIAAYCARQLWGTSYPRLGRMLGKRSSQGAMYLVRRTEGLYEYDRRIQDIVDRVMEMETTI